MVLMPMEGENPDTEEEEEKRAEGEERPKEPPKKPEAKPEKPEKPEVEIRSPLEREEFEPLLDLFQRKTGVGDRKQAAMLLARAFRQAGADPSTDIEEAMRFANNLCSVLQVFPDTPLTEETKGALMNAGMTRAFQMATSETPPEDRAVRIVERLLPVKEAFRIMRDEDSTSKPNPELQRLGAEIQALKEQMKKKEEAEEFERQISPLKSQISKLEEHLGKLAERIEKTKGSTAPAPPPAESKEVAKLREELGDLRKKLEEKDRMIERAKLKEEVIGKVADMLDKKLGEIEKKGDKGTIGELKELVGTLRELGIPVGGGRDGWPSPKEVPTWAWMIKDPEFRKGLREVATDMIEDFAGAVTRGIGKITPEETGIAPPPGLVREEKPVEMRTTFETTAPPPEAKAVELPKETTATTVPSPEIKVVEPKEKPEVPKPPRGIPGGGEKAKKPERPRDKRGRFVKMKKEAGS
ncbi:MAG: hypothetical protein JRD89_11705 [Deltaproteobacteria bacterium]|nr:hypothetical protein [Deltaproteobacteria bacterium]